MRLRAHQKYIYKYFGAVGLDFTVRSLSCVHVLFLLYSVMETGVQLALAVPTVMPIVPVVLF